MKQAAPIAAKKPEGKLLTKPITDSKIEPDLFKSVTGLNVSDFELLVQLGVFNSIHMNQAVFAFRRYEDSSLAYTGIDRRAHNPQIGLYEAVISS